MIRLIVLGIFVSLSVLSCSGSEKNKASEHSSEAQAAEIQKKNEQGLSDIPIEVRNLVFGNERFAKQIVFRISGEADREEANRYKQKSQADESCVINAPGATGACLPRGFAVNGANFFQPWLTAEIKLLLGNDFMKLDSVDCQYRQSTGRIDRAKAWGFYYADSIRPYVLPPQNQVNYWTLSIAGRLLKEITYKKKYKHPGSEDITVFSFTFNYVYKEYIPNFPHVDAVFTGKVRSYQDPDDGQWKLDELELSDKKGDEYKAIGASIPSEAILANLGKSGSISSLEQNSQMRPGNGYSIDEMKLVRIDTTMAILEGPDGKKRSYKEGDRLSDGFITAVAPERVIFVRDRQDKSGQAILIRYSYNLTEKDKKLVKEFFGGWEGRSAPTVGGKGILVKITLAEAGENVLSGTADFTSYIGRLSLVKVVEESKAIILREASEKPPVNRFIYVTKNADGTLDCQWTNDINDPKFFAEGVLTRSN